MNFLVLFFAIIPSVLAFQYYRQKYPYKPGVICNYDIYPTISEQVVVRYYCVPESQCNATRPRSPVMPQSDEYCDHFISDVPYEERLVCCHSADIPGNRTISWSQQNTYITGLRSWLMCRDHAHALCSPQGDSYCMQDLPDPPQTPIQGLISKIDKYPHTVTIGSKAWNYWNWRCLGSIISKRFVLTAGKCTKKVDGFHLFVKAGETRMCQYCPYHPEVQLIAVQNYFPKYYDEWYYQDFGLLELAEDIKFNRRVRPACLVTEYDTRETQGWFAFYGKRELWQISPPNIITPYFMNLSLISHGDSIVSFRVKARGEEVYMYFSNFDDPYQPEKGLEVVFGTSGNSQSYIKSDNEKTVVDTDKIIDDNDYRGFWIQMLDNYVAVGKEDEIVPFMTRNVSNTNFSLFAFGSPHFGADWHFPDHYSLFALRDMEIEVTYKDTCGRYYRNNTYLDKEGLIDEIMFCAGHLRSGKAPCDEDWGGAIQVMDDRHYCMWQIFGVFVKDEALGYCPGRARKPAVFNSVAPVLEWIESIAFKDFAIANISVDSPDCTYPESYRTRTSLTRC